MLNAPVNCGIIDFDVSGSGRKDEQLLLKMRADLRDMLTEVLKHIGVAFDDLPYENLGDGFRLILPPSISLTKVLRHIIQELDYQLRSHRKAASDLAQLRLRMAVHQGNVYRDAGGLGGAALKDVARLLNAAPVKAALVAQPDANLVLVVSEDVYNDVIRHGWGPNRDAFQKVRITEKELKQQNVAAWIYIPDSPALHRPPGGTDRVRSLGVNLQRAIVIAGLVVAVAGIVVALLREDFRCTVGIGDCTSTSGRFETTGGDTQTWSDYTSGGGSAGPVIPKGAGVLVSCRTIGLKLNNGNAWWYRIASPDWSNRYWASADAFYNNGMTSGPLKDTPFVDESVPICAG